MRDCVDLIVECLVSPSARSPSIIDWSAPIISFGDLKRSCVATIGINPSNLEFVDPSGTELDGLERRFHTLKSLDLRTWQSANHSHLASVIDTCRTYFARNPYDRWFGVLDRLLGVAGSSYYGSGANACHLDLIPYATHAKWSMLSITERSELLNSFGRILGLTLRQSSIATVVLNGQSVVHNLQAISGELGKEKRPDWSLTRAGQSPVMGVSFNGHISKVAGIELGRPVRVLGFNHNLQSSFGVTNDVIRNIGDWLKAEVAA